MACEEDCSTSDFLASARPSQKFLLSFL